MILELPSFAWTEITPFPSTVWYFPSPSFPLDFTTSSKLIQLLLFHVIWLLQPLSTFQRSWDFIQCSYINRRVGFILLPIQAILYFFFLNSTKFQFINNWNQITPIDNLILEPPPKKTWANPVKGSNHPFLSLYTPTLSILI